MSMNLVHAKISAGDLLESIVAAQHSERPTVKAGHLDDAQHYLERLARELGFKVERIAAPVKDAA